MSQLGWLLCVQTHEKGPCRGDKSAVLGRHDSGLAIGSFGLDDGPGFAVGPSDLAIFMGCWPAKWSLKEPNVP